MLVFGQHGKEEGREEDHGWGKKKLSHASALLKAGYSTAKAAKTAGIGRTTLSDIAQFKKPVIGALSVHSATCGG